MKVSVNDEQHKIVKHIPNISFYRVCCQVAFYDGKYYLSDGISLLWFVLETEEFYVEEFEVKKPKRACYLM